MQLNVRHLSGIALILGLGLTLAGCGLQDTKAYQSGRDFYQTYLNAPVKVDLQNPRTLAEADSRLVSRIMNVDIQMTNLERTLDAYTQLPSEAQTEALFTRFPWLASASVLNPQGAVVRQAYTGLNQDLDFSPLLEISADQMARDLRLNIQNTAQGPKLLIAKPFTQGNQVLTYFVVSFDLPTLLQHSTDASALVARTPELELWTGNSAYAGTSLAGHDWIAELKRRTSGSITVDGQNMLWLARYFGLTPIIFATRAE